MQPSEIYWTTTELTTGSATSTTFKSYAQPRAPVEIDMAHFKSQSGEDRKLLEWFGGLSNGTYLEIGGLDGMTFSNTYVFNKALGWKGVLIELSTQNFAELVKNRPNEIATINAGVCDEKRILHYVEGRGATNGIWEFASQSFKDKWWTELTLDSPSVKPLECAPLADLLEPHVGPSFFFDFFSLDVEGAEFEILKAIDFSRLGFGIILTEADEHHTLKNLVLRNLLESKGYTFLMEYARSYWFAHGKFAEIYQNKLIPKGTK